MFEALGSYERTVEKEKAAARGKEKRDAAAMQLRRQGQVFLTKFFSREVLLEKAGVGDLKAVYFLQTNKRCPSKGDDNKPLKKADVLALVRPVMPALPPLPPQADVQSV